MTVAELDNTTSKMLDERQVADLLGLPVARLRVYVGRGLVPEPEVKLSRRCWRWRPSSILAFVRGERGGGPR
jgi:predicted DNA-binding transcriptional regulator AlpA